MNENLDYYYYSVSGQVLLQLRPSKQESACLYLINYSPLIKTFNHIISYYFNQEKSNKPIVTALCISNAEIDVYPYHARGHEDLMIKIIYNW